MFGLGANILLGRASLASAAWAAIARAFGGRVASVLGPVGILSDITGVMSGRIRADTFDNLTSDILGLPSEADRQKQLERRQKAFNPHWKPGDPIIIWAGDQPGCRA